MSIDSTSGLPATEAIWFREGRYLNPETWWGWRLAGQLAKVLPSWLKTRPPKKGKLLSTGVLFETSSVPLLLIPRPAVREDVPLVVPFSIVSPEMAAVVPLAIVIIRLALSPLAASALGPGHLMERFIAISISPPVSMIVEHPKSGPKSTE